MANEIRNIKELKKLGSSDDRQGKVTLCEGDVNGNLIRFISKIPKKVGFLSTHEAQILKDLNTLNLPHFCQYLGNSENKVYMEYVNDEGKVRSLDSFIQKDFDITMNLIKQIIMALAISQRKIQFTHYDLHCDNVLVKNVDPNSVYLYVVDEQNQFCVPTNGHCAVIIDYGYSYTQNTGTYGSLEFTELGYTPNFYDPYIDCIRFLITTSRISRNSGKEYKIFRNIVRNIYPVSDNISMTSGWFRKAGKIGLLEAIKEKLGEMTSESILYKKCIQSLMIIQGMVKKNFEYSFQKLSADYYRFSQEFEKLTAGFSPKQKLETLKQLIVSIVDDQPFDKLEINTKYTDFDTLKEYLSTLRDSVSGFVTQFTKTIEQRKSEIYSGIKLTTEQIFGALDFNFNSEFKFDDETTVFMWKDCKMTEFKIPAKYIKKVNRTVPPLRGTLIYDIYVSEFEA